MPQLFGYQFVVPVDRNCRNGLTRAPLEPMIVSSTAHPDGKAGVVAKAAALLCFAIAAGLMIASLMTSQPAKATPKSASAPTTQPVMLTLLR
jgi:hypothetical protein